MQCPKCNAKSNPILDCLNSDLICENGHTWHHHHLPGPEAKEVNVMGARQDPAINCPFCRGEAVITNKHYAFRMHMKCTKEGAILREICHDNIHDHDDRLSVDIQLDLPHDLTCGKGHYWHAHPLNGHLLWLSLPSNKKQEELVKEYQDWLPCILCTYQESLCS